MLKQRVQLLRRKLKKWRKSLKLPIKRLNKLRQRQKRLQNVESLKARLKSL